MVLIKWVGLTRLDLMTLSALGLENVRKKHKLLSQATQVLVVTYKLIHVWIEVWTAWRRGIGTLLKKKLGKGAGMSQGSCSAVSLTYRL